MVVLELNKISMFREASFREFQVSNASSRLKQTAYLSYHRCICTECNLLSVYHASLFEWKERGCEWMFIFALVWALSELTRSPLQLQVWAFSCRLRLALPTGCPCDILYQLFNLKQRPILSANHNYRHSKSRTWKLRLDLESPTYNGSLETRKSTASAKLKVLH